ncbi:hypothetical protein CDD82_7323 [Ophiocordyceps australis]|uniref:J domain-containing protein n=1 Tax=Ophiocordyceps australis TaxID=1399860 RepID=A0A2C5ZPS7_9HYPO|nr:hypothetical protein CDD82_7323 [Ophiocordyceps australis]
MERNAPPDYYAILDIAETATDQQVRDAYKRAALKTHPDRVAADSPERASRTRKFQLVNDAYYTLSDSNRRREYDAQRRLFSHSKPGTNQQDPHDAHDAEPQDAYSWAWNFFNPPAADRQHAQDEQFGNVFEEMMREQGMAEDDGSNTPTSRFWAVIGGISGGALGFILANIPGMLAGAVAGNRLGAVRDAKGKSVYAVYQELPQSDRAKLLSQLAIRVFSHAAGL